MPNRDYRRRSFELVVSRGSLIERYAFCGILNTQIFMCQREILGAYANQIDKTCRSAYLSIPVGYPFKRITKFCDTRLKSFSVKIIDLRANDNG